MNSEASKLIYLDHAATSRPKPDCVAEAIRHALCEIGANPGRSGHRLANDAERVRFDAREALAKLVGVNDPTRVVFTLNGTHALNLALHGLLSPPAHVVTTGIEHNAVMRPLRALAQRGVEVDVAPGDLDGSLDPAEIERRIRPDTRLVVVNHASNVSGTLLPVREIGVRANSCGVPLLVDAAQTAGCVPLNLAADHIDLLAFTGHKALLGPMGTGGLIIRDDFDIERLPPLAQGGTGSRSEFDEQPPFLPDKFESGTPNIVGLAGLAAGVNYVQQRGIGAIRAHEQALTRQLLDGLGAIPGISLVGPRDPARQTAVVSFRAAGQSVADLAHALDERFHIMCRPGLHCAPRAHQTLGTFPDGTVRFAPGLFTTATEIDRAIAAVRQVVGVESS